MNRLSFPHGSMVVYIGLKATVFLLCITIYLLHRKILWREECFADLISLDTSLFPRKICTWGSTKVHSVKLDESLPLLKLITKTLQQNVMKIGCKKSYKNNWNVLIKQDWPSIFQVFKETIGYSPTIWNVS